MMKRNCLSSSGVWIGGVAVLLWALMPAMVFGQASGTPAGFEIDGDQVCESDATSDGVGDDWADNSGPACDGEVDPAEDVGEAQFTDCNWGPGSIVRGDPTQFKTGSNKNCDFIGDPALPGNEDQEPWVYTSNGGGPQKNDITNTYAHVRKSCTKVKGDVLESSFTECANDDACSDGTEMCHTWIFVGAETRSTNGDSHLDFEINQAGVFLDNGDGCQYPGSCCENDTEGNIIGRGLENGRTDGDISLDMSFRRGGSQPVLTVRIWEDDSYDFATGQLVGISIFSQTNLDDIKSGTNWTGFNSNGSENTDSLDVTALQFVEGAIDQTALGLDFVSCTANATMLVKSRSSHSNNDVDFCNAQLKDFVLFDFPLAIPPACEIRGENQICENASDDQTSTFCLIPQNVDSNDVVTDVDSNGYGDFGYAWDHLSCASDFSCDRCITVACPLASSPCTFEGSVLNLATGCTSDPCTRDLNITPKPSAAVVDPADQCVDRECDGGDNDEMACVDGDDCPGGSCVEVPTCFFLDGSGSNGISQSWTIVSQSTTPATCVQASDISSPNTFDTDVCFPAGCFGTATFRLTNAGSTTPNPDCPDATADVTVEVFENPTCSFDTAQDDAFLLYGDVSNGTGPYTCSAAVVPAAQGWSATGCDMVCSGNNLIQCTDDDGCTGSGTCTDFVASYSVNQTASPASEAIIQVTVTDDNGCMTSCDHRVAPQRDCVTHNHTFTRCDQGPAQFCVEANTGLTPMIATWNVCSAGSDNAGVPCAIDGDCSNGTCGVSQGGLSLNQELCIPVTEAGCYRATVTDALGFVSAPCDECAVIVQGVQSSCP